jgi:threonine/homoserine efflux transporter RhtA
VGLLTGVAPVSAAVTGIVTGGQAPRLLVWLGILVVICGLAAGLWTRPGRAARLPRAPAAQAHAQAGGP